MKKQLINTLLIVTAVSLSVLPAQAVGINEQLTAEQNIQQSQFTQEEIKEATTSSFCTASRRCF